MAGHPWSYHWVHYLALLLILTSCAQSAPLDIYNIPAGQFLASCSNDSALPYNGTATAGVFLPRCNGGPLPSNTATPLQDRVICVYPISGQYDLLSRVLYYVLLVFSIFSRHHPWLVTGALV